MWHLEYDGDGVFHPVNPTDDSDELRVLMDRMRYGWECEGALRKVTAIDYFEHTPADKNNSAVLRGGPINSAISRLKKIAKDEDLSVEVLYEPVIAAWPALAAFLKDRRAREVSEDQSVLLQRAKTESEFIRFMIRRLDSPFYDHYGFRDYHESIVRHLEWRQNSETDEGVEMAFPFDLSPLNLAYRALTDAGNNIVYLREMATILRG